uniref:Mannosyl-glycoprotein endo-beta-N-acetylglucosaminidase n=1 Tax=Globodera rostochiensis TaxID=31243 RepID=A0A914I4K3_GLORO
MEKENNFVYFDSLNSILSGNLQILSQQRQCPLYDLVNFNWKSNRPKTLVCHDHRGGYMDYESLSGSRICAKESEDGSNIPFYSFFHWWHIDIFVYFSHHFVTIPPFAWTNQAHKHGVLILGTFIIENAHLCQQTFAKKETIDQLVASLVNCCVVFKFDGWLINIESEVELDGLDNLEYFLLSLRNEMHDKVHNDAKVIWYDSVTMNGKLAWQNALNANNLRWLKKKTLFDIYIGIDVFGRGCMGDGGWNCVQPLEMIRHYALSTAIFAPGWICEKFPGAGHQSLFVNNFRFWNTLREFLRPHRLHQRNICTKFVVGFASEHLNWCSKNEGDDRAENNHFCLQNADLQPFYLCSAAFGKDMEAGLIVTGMGIHDLFLCDTPIEETDEKIELRYQCSHPIDLIVTVTGGRESVHFCQHSTASNEANDRHEKGLDNVMDGLMSVPDGAAVDLQAILPY